MLNLNSINSQLVTFKQVWDEMLAAQQERTVNSRWSPCNQNHFVNGSKKGEFTLEEIPATVTMTLGVSSWKNTSHPARKTGSLPRKQKCKPKRKGWVTRKSA